MGVLAGLVLLSVLALFGALGAEARPVQIEVRSAEGVSLGRLAGSREDRLPYVALTDVARPPGPRRLGRAPAPAVATASLTPRPPAMPRPAPPAPARPAPRAEGPAPRQAAGAEPEPDPAPAAPIKLGAVELRYRSYPGYTRVVLEGAAQFEPRLGGSRGGAGGAPPG